MIVLTWRTRERRTGIATVQNLPQKIEKKRPWCSKRIPTKYQVLNKLKTKSFFFTLFDFRTGFAGAPKTVNPLAIFFVTTEPISTHCITINTHFNACMLQNITTENE